MQTVTETLVRARTFLASGWNQHTNALNAAGSEVSATDPDAVSWCALGAIDRAVDGHDDEARNLTLATRQSLYRLLKYPCHVISDFNDSASSVEDVLALFDRAIAAERRGGL